MIAERTVLLGVTGSIAAYRAAEIASKLTQAGAQVYVILTENACRFIGAATFTNLTGHKAITDMWTDAPEEEIGHISLSERADLILIAPASANVIGKIASGIADDMLTTTVMASAAPVLIAPAMNVRMFSNPIVRENIRKLREYGYGFVEPEAGRLACGAVGQGRLASLEVILAAVECSLARGNSLAGKRFLITAGPTREPLDPVRYLSNRSSGKMGYALAQAALSRGADVTLITGPTSLPAPCGASVIEIETAAELERAALEEFESSDVAICAAAVADFRPPKAAESKIKKNPGQTELTVVLERTPDVLAEMGKRKEGRVLVGFAAETEDLIINASAKLRAKNCDMFVANDITLAGAGFEAETNVVTILSADGESAALPLMSKRQVAEAILDRIAALLGSRPK